MNHTITKSISDIFSRPADSNYDSMETLLEVAEQEKAQSRTIKVQGSDIGFSTEAGEFRLDIAGKVPLPLTNYSMTQVALMAKIPTALLERLHERDRDDLVVDNLKTLFPNRRAETKFILIRDHYDEFGGIDSVARAVNGGAYSRLWDCDVFAEIEDFLLERDFTPMLPDEQSGMRNGLMHGLDTGLFRGDECSFGFFFTTRDLGADCADLGGLTPGMMVFNSEVGARSFGYHTFYYHEASGSIIMWTPANHKRKRFVHRGDISKAFKEYIATLEDVADNFKTRYIEDVKTFDIAAVTPFAVDDTAAIQRLHKSFGMSVSNAKAAVGASKMHCNNYGLPLSVWNIALGITYEAGQTSRAEALVDQGMIATRLMRSTLKV